MTDESNPDAALRACPEAPPAGEHHVIDWESIPVRCGEFRVVDIGEYDRCTFTKGHTGPCSCQALDARKE